MKRIIILLIGLLIILIVPINALEVAVLSFEENLDQSSFIFTADQTKILVTSFLVDKDAIEEVPIYITDVSNLSKLNISVEYDKNIIYPENISAGEFNITYFVEDGLQIVLDLNETFSRDFLLAKIYFRAIGEEGESSSLTIKVNKLLDENSNQIPYLTVDGMLSIKTKDIKENGNEGLEEILSKLINAENRSKFAEENNLKVEDNRVKVIIETENLTEEKWVDIDDIPDLLNNKSIKNIRSYKTIPKELIIVGLILLSILIILRFKK